MKEMVVNRAVWNPPVRVPDGWVIGNAPRPIRGEITWQGEFRHGVFYAASPEVPAGSFGWEADDAWLVRFTGNAEIEQQVMAKLAEHGYESIEEVAGDVGEVAVGLGFPWYEETAS